ALRPDQRIRFFHFRSPFLCSIPATDGPTVLMLHTVLSKTIPYLPKSDCENEAIVSVGQTERRTAQYSVRLRAHDDSQLLSVFALDADADFLLLDNEPY